ncbi:MAG: alpha/beta hydrolase fold domain-containing protein [Saprospiraceae bacterium]|nr:alpha/beta hydrolase fold domain-containing protein [Saprospiraceae bacterium]
MSIARFQHLVPNPNILVEGLRLPWWLLRIQNLPKPAKKLRKHRYGPHFRQYYLHYEPAKNVAERDTVIIYTHGSGWQFGRPEMFEANAQWLSEQGFHSFFLSHRRVPQSDIRGLRSDMASAVLAVSQQVEALGMAGKKIVLAGNSAGGHLSALAFFDETLLEAVGRSPRMFSALALFAAPLDLDCMWPSPPLLLLTNGKRNPEFSLSNPILQVKKAENRPVLILHGDMDGVVEFENSRRFYQRLLDFGSTNLRFETLQKGYHLDSASWCIPSHESSLVFKDWLSQFQ